MVRFSPRRGTASAMVAMAAILRKLGSVLSRVRIAVAPLEQSLRQLERNGSAAEGFLRIGAARLIGIEDGERLWQPFVPVKQMVIGDDEVQAQPVRCFRFSKGAHPGVDGDDQTHTLGAGSLKHVRLQAIALRECDAAHESEPGRPAFRSRS